MNTKARDYSGYCILAVLALSILGGCAQRTATGGIRLYVSPLGNDANPGTISEPFATLERARNAVRILPKQKGESVAVILREGTHYLPNTLVFTATDSGLPDAVIQYRSADGEEAIISGGIELNGLEWTAYRDGIMQTKVPAGFSTDQLFVNGQQMPMARYPNYDPQAKCFGGTAADAFSEARVAKWSQPAGGFMHVLHNARWGGMHYRITGKDSNGALKYEGGWQNNRGSRWHRDIRFVENIFNFPTLAEAYRVAALDIAKQRKR